MKSIRIVIFAKSKGHTRIYFYFKKAFKKIGHQPLWIKYSKLKSYLGEKLATAVAEKILFGFKPNLLFFHGRDLPYELLQRASQQMPTVMYYDDCIKGTGDGLSQVVKYGQQASIMYITNRSETHKYIEWGINAKFITGGCDPIAHRMVRKPSRFFQSEVAFIGKPNTPERVECMREVSKNFELKLWGSGWEKFGMSAQAKNVYASEYRKICAGTKIILGWNIDPSVDLYFSNRTWYTLGCGGFLLTLYSPSLEELFGRGMELDWFESIEECCQKIQYYLDHDEERTRIAQAGYQLAHEKYSYEKMVEKILQDLHENSSYQY